MARMRLDRQNAALVPLLAGFDEGVRLAAAAKSLADNSGVLDLVPRYETRLGRLYERAAAKLLTLRKNAALLHPGEGPAPSPAQTELPQRSHVDAESVLPNEPEPAPAPRERCVTAAVRP